MKALLFNLIPGGQVAAWFVSFGRAIAAAWRYTWDGVAQCFTHPTTLIVCGFFAFGGAYGMAHYVRHQVEEARAEKRELVADLKRKDKDDATVAKLAAAARERAEREAYDRGKREGEEAARKAADTPGAPPPVVSPASMQPIRRAGPTIPKCAAGMLGSFQAVFWTCR